jgi:hypothetical protein
MLDAAVSSEVMILTWSWETYYFASSEESVGPSYARMAAGSSALAVREPDARDLEAAVHICVDRAQDDGMDRYALADQERSQ